MESIQGSSVINNSLEVNNILHRRAGGILFLPTACYPESKLKNGIFCITTLNLFCSCMHADSEFVIFDGMKCYRYITWLYFNNTSSSNINCITNSPSAIAMLICNLCFSMMGMSLCTGICIAEGQKVYTVGSAWA